MVQVDQLVLSLREHRVCLLRLADQWDRLDQLDQEDLFLLSDPQVLLAPVDQAILEHQVDPNN